MEARDLRRMTIDEYIALDRASDERWEYVGGEAFAMAGASPEHNIVVANIAGALRSALRGKPCLAMSEGQKIASQRTRSYFHPDAIAVCGTPRRDERDDYAIVNPTVIVEVLSDSTEAHDRGAKFAHYRHLASLREYVLVAQDERRVEVYRRNEGGRFELFEAGASERFELASIGVSLAVDEIYANPLAPG